MRSKIKGIWSLVLSFAMVVTLFMWNGVEAEAAVVESVVVSNVEKYDNGFLKSIDLSYHVGYPSAGTPVPVTPARVSVQTQQFTDRDFTEFGSYALNPNHGYREWPDEPADCGFIAWSSIGTFNRPRTGEDHSITITFAENAIDLNTPQTCYVYMWVYYDGGSGSYVYPDAYVYEFTTGTGDFTGSTTPPNDGGESEPTISPATYYVNNGQEGCILCTDQTYGSVVPAGMILKYGDVIKCGIEGAIRIEDGITSAAVAYGSEGYRVPDGRYTYSISGDSGNGFTLTLTRVTTGGTASAEPVAPSASSTPASAAEKEEETAPALTAPVLKSTNYAGDELCSWQEVIDAIATIEPKKLTDSNPEDTQSVLKVDISSTAGFVGHEVLQTLAKKDDASLHVFTGNGVAITFDGADTKDDAKAVRVTNKVSDTQENGKRVHIVDFLEKGKMENAVAFHVNLPHGADSSVDVYTENKDGIQNHIRTMKADSAGNVALMINTKEKFIFKY